LDLNGEIVNHIQDNKVNNYLFNAWRDLKSMAFICFLYELFK
jgi:hypothetical protein